jgi:hypothetical protein
MDGRGDTACEGLFLAAEAEAENENETSTPLDTPLIREEVRQSHKLFSGEGRPCT